MAFQEVEFDSLDGKAGATGQEMRQKILVIDDDDLVRKSLRQVLKKEGYLFVVTKDAFEALDKVREQDFDLIISDIRMPGMDGVQAIREIRRLFDETGKGDVPIIFITGYATTSQELGAEWLGEVIIKPFDVERLLMTIREYL